MSRTWQAHSRGDQTCGERRQLTSGVLEMTSAQPAELARTMSATFSARISRVSTPHSGQGRSRTHVQPLLFGTISINSTVADDRPMRVRGQGG